MFEQFHTMSINFIQFSKFLAHGNRAARAHWQLNSAHLALRRLLRSLARKCGRGRGAEVSEHAVLPGLQRVQRLAYLLVGGKEILALLLVAGDHCDDHGPELRNLFMKDVQSFGVRIFLFQDFVFCILTGLFFLSAEYFDKYSR